eukprot:742859-Hanusia_phi.AAC.1
MKFVWQRITAAGKKSTSIHEGCNLKTRTKMRRGGKREMGRRETRQGGLQQEGEEEWCRRAKISWGKTALSSATSHLPGLPAQDGRVRRRGYMGVVRCRGGGGGGDERGMEGIKAESANPRLARI